MTPGGKLIFDAYAGDRLDDAIFAAGSGQDERVASVTVEGRRWDVFERSVIWPSRQRIDASYTHVPHDGGEPVRATIRQRYLTSHQISELLSRAGLALASLEGGFHGETFERDSPHLVVRAERWTPRPDPR